MLEVSFGFDLVLCLGPSVLVFDFGVGSGNGFGIGLGVECPAESFVLA